MKIFIPFLAIAGAAIAAPESCENLAHLSLDHTSITVAETGAAGGFTVPQGAAIHNLPAFCRVAGSIRPTSGSDIRFEVWLPASGWNGKFQGIGNGGYAGAIGYSGLGNAITHGYASASTDTGHSAAAGCTPVSALH